MPAIIALINAIGARAILFVVAMLGVLGIGSISDKPIQDQMPEKVVEEVAYIEPIEPNDEIEDKVPEEPESKEKIVEKPIEETEVEYAPQPEVEVVVDIPVPEPVLPSKSLNEINKEIGGAVVNILCTTLNGGLLQPISGSGVFIDPRGVILTNAHIAQYLLLKDYQVENYIECVARTGSPARAAYKLDLLHISLEWIVEHAPDIVVSSPTGTGENDFALLYVTGMTDASIPLPKSFTYVPVDVTEESIEKNAQVLVRSYPAGFISGISVQKDLYAVATIDRIRNFYTFTDTPLDLISVGGSIAAQGGSSGGAVISNNGNLIGIIVTASREETTAERDLRAITLAHINRSLLINKGFTLNTLLLGDIGLQANLFNITTAPILTKLLTQELEK